MDGTSNERKDIGNRKDGNLSETIKRGINKENGRSWIEANRNILFEPKPTSNVKIVSDRVYYKENLDDISGIVVNVVFKDLNDLFKLVGIRVWKGISKIILRNTFTEGGNLEQGRDMYQV